MKNFRRSLVFGLVTAFVLVAGNAFGQSNSIRIVEVPTKTESVLLNVCVITPELSSREQAAWAVLASSISEGNQLYSAYDIFRYGYQAEDSPQIEWNDEVLTIQLTMPKDGLNLGLRMIDAMLRKPLLDRESATRRIEELSSPVGSDIGAVFFGQLGELNRVDTRILNSTFTRVFDPKNVSISVNSGATVGSRANEIKTFFAEWKSRNSPSDTWGPSVKKFSGPATSLLTVWKAPAISMKMTDSADFLAMIALGCGLESIAFRELREKNGWSYAQDIYLRMERKGWRPLFLMVGDPVSPVEIKDVMFKAAEKLDEFQLKRAKGLANGILTRGNPMSPIFVSPGGQYLADDRDRIAWGAFAVNFGGVSQTELLANSIQEVDLASLKDATKRLITALEP